MIGNVDLDLLEKTYQNASIGITAIESVLGKASNKEFSNDLNNQLKDYQELAEKSKTRLIENGAEVKDKSFYTKTMMKGNIKMNTIINSSDSHIAQMVIQGSTMGVTQMTRLLHDNKNADGECTQIAKEFVKKEEENIEVMKNYL
ncbi:MAG: hypothetical protein ACYDEX_17780 [Mobilitalea sp.]